MCWNHHSWNWEYCPHITNNRIYQLMTVFYPDHWTISYNRRKIGHLFIAKILSAYSLLVSQLHAYRIVTWSLFQWPNLLKVAFSPSPSVVEMFNFRTVYYTCCAHKEKQKHDYYKMKKNTQHEKRATERNEEVFVRIATEFNAKWKHTHNMTHFQF